MSGNIIENTYVSIPLLGSVLVDVEISEASHFEAKLSEGLNNFYNEVVKKE